MFQILEQGLQAGGRDANEQASGGLRIEPQHDLGLVHFGLPHKVLARVFHVAFDGAGDHALADRLQRAREGGQGVGPDLGRHARVPGQADQVPEEPEPRHIRAGRHVRAGGRIGGGAV